MLRQSCTRLSRAHCYTPGPIHLSFFSTSRTFHANRAVVYTENGNPAEVLRVQSYDPLPPPPPGSLNIRFCLAPINPSDINLIQGVYPVQPAQLQLSGEQVFVGGNEGVAEVTETGTGVEGIQKGDKVVVARPQFGTWSSSRVLRAEDVIKLPSSGLSEVNAATITVSILVDPLALFGSSHIRDVYQSQVNPPTAYNMLTDFVKLQEDDWVLQNGTEWFTMHVHLPNLRVNTQVPTARYEYLASA